MDRIKQYGEIIRQAVCGSNECMNASVADDGIETLFLCDLDAGQFELLNLGWQGKKRVCSITLLVRLKDDKIWIEEDWTEDGIASRLLELGIPHGDIVLAFHPPHLRPLTDFAAA